MYTHAEDYALWIKLMPLPHVHIPKPLIFYQLHAKQVSSSFRLQSILSRYKLIVDYYGNCRWSRFCRVFAALISVLRQLELSAFGLIPTNTARINVHARYNRFYLSRLPFYFMVCALFPFAFIFSILIQVTAGVPRGTNSIGS